MKLQLTRSTPAGVLTVEEDLADAAHAVDVVRKLEAALSTAVRDVAARHALPDLSEFYAPVIATDPDRPGVGDRELGSGDRSLPPTTQLPDPTRFAPCDPPPATGLELWRWAYNVGCCKRVLALGRAYGLRHASRGDVYKWDADNVSQVYHEIQVKPTKGART